MSIGEFDLRARLSASQTGAAEASAAEGDDEHLGGESKCSRAGCTNPAVTRLEWRNPRIHAADRIKIWLACDEHHDFLLGFLTSRNFPVRTHAFADAVDVEPIA